MLPDFSPALLALFLEGRIHRLAALEFAPGAAGLKAARRAFPGRFAKACGAPRAMVALALAGRLREAAPRARLWAALGHFPADHGLTLTDDGGCHGGA